MPDDVFKGVLIRERRRADRFNRPFLLLVVPVNGQRFLERSVVWSQTIEALAAAKRESDVLGWIEPQSVLGIIMPEVDVTDAEHPCKIEARVRRELAKRLSAPVAAALPVRFHLYCPPDHADARSGGAVDPIVYSLCTRADQNPVRDGLKRGLDIVGSLTMVTLLAPVFLVVAALIKWKSPGPVLFRQVRIGRMAMPFEMLKFRTMAVGADHGLHRKFVTQFVKSSDNPQESADGPVFKITKDPRVTPIGHVLRKTSLDELPQFWNVLRGDMSLVGPRPPLAYELEQYQPWHWRRVMEAKPGLTGLWQVTGRSRTTFDGMVRLDLRYAKAASLWTDIKILLATPKAVISGKGAC
jgi:lipopolysaccharide/colanic/teichoic acid biosynthesis glycosyltransferase